MTTPELAFLRALAAWSQDQSKWDLVQNAGREYTAAVRQPIARDLELVSPAPTPNVQAMEETMFKLYHLVYDDQSYWVEAVSVPEAIRVWREDRRETYADEADYGGWDGTEEPESITLVHDEPVIRTTPNTTLVGTFDPSKERDHSLSPQPSSEGEVKWPRWYKHPTALFVLAVDGPIGEAFAWSGTGIVAAEARADGLRAVTRTGAFAWTQIDHSEAIRLIPAIAEKYPLAQPPKSEPGKPYTIDGHNFKNVGGHDYRCERCGADQNEVQVGQRCVGAKVDAAKSEPGGEVAWPRFFIHNRDADEPLRDYVIVVVNASGKGRSFWSTGGRTQKDNLIADGKHALRGVTDDGILRWVEVDHEEAARIQPGVLEEFPRPSPRQQPAQEAREVAEKCVTQARSSWNSTVPYGPSLDSCLIHEFALALTAYSTRVSAEREEAKSTLKFNEKCWRDERVKFWEMVERAERERDEARADAANWKRLAEANCKAQAQLRSDLAAMRERVERIINFHTDLAGECKRARTSFGSGRASGIRGVIDDLAQLMAKGVGNG